MGRVTETLRDDERNGYRYAVSRRRPAAPRLAIRLLGPPEVSVDGHPLVVDTRKAVAILALLAADGRPYARDELAAILWPDSDEAAARGALRRTLSTLRAAIGDGPLLIDRGRVDLDRRLVSVDLTSIESAAAAHDRAALAAAAALVRGGFLAGFNLRDSPEFDDWRATRAVAAERSVLLVLDRLATVTEAEGDLATAIEATERRLALDPLDEAGHVRLMDLLVAAGDRSAALRQYRACVAVLERELGVAPLVTTTARYEAIRDGDATSPVATRAPAEPIGDGPVADLPLVGRDGALATILAAHETIRGSEGAIVAVIGEAGIGKTRLVDEAAARIRHGGGIVLRATAHPAERGIAYGAIVELLRTGLARPDAATRRRALAPITARELARLLPAIDPGATPTASADGPGAHARLVAAITDGLEALAMGPVPGLIWVDDVQWIDAASLEALGFLARRLAGHPLLVVFAWRPEDLDADGITFTERILDRAAATVVLERLDRDAIAALVRSAGRDDLDPELEDRLAAASEGLPLYLVEALAGPLDADPTTLPATVGAVLRERLATVPETAAQVLSAASVIGRAFDLATVRFASGRSEDEAVDAVEACVARGLIRETSAGFDFAHGALRDLAYDATSLTRRRLLHRRVAEALRRDLLRGGRADLARLVLIAGHERAAGRDAEAAAAYRAAGVQAADVYANREAVELYGSALALGDPDTIGLHAAIGRLRTRLGDYAGAIEAFEAAAAVATADELPELEWSLARAHLRRGDLVAADRHLDAAAAAGSDDRLLARILVDRSIVRRRAGDPAGVREAAQAALAVADRAADPVAAGAAHRLLGLAALDTGQAGQAIDDLEIAVRSAAEDPDPTAMIAALVGLAIAQGRAGDTAAAVTNATTAAQACRRIGDRHLEAAVENHLADLLHEAGRDAEARPHQLRAAEAFAEVGGSPADPDPGIWMLSAS